MPEKNRSANTKIVFRVGEEYYFPSCEEDEEE